MIPKVIHYCWFGGKELPKPAKKCIKSWKKYCPDYEIKRWDEENFDISSCPAYVRQAYENKKWAFVTDYVRLKIVYENGGVYLDTDVEMRKNLDRFMDYHAFFGFENGMYINTGSGFGAEKQSLIVRKIMEQYNNISFINSDGTYDLTPCPTRNTVVFEEIGLKRDDSLQVLENEILILPSEYFCPVNSVTKEKNITTNTYTIHWFSGSWIPLKLRIKTVIYNFLKKILGEKKLRKIISTVKKVMRGELK